jgi:hypothetical protein
MTRFVCKLCGQRIDDNLSCGCGARELIGWKPHSAAWKNPGPFKPGALRLTIANTCPGQYVCQPRDYDLGVITGWGSSIEEAAADFCELYADHEVVAQLTECWDQVNVLGGSWPDWRTSKTFAGGYNKAIGDALELIERLGGRSLATRSKVRP